MQVNARLSYLRMSPRKVRLVIDLVRGLPVSSAVHQLEFCPKEAAKPVLKLLQSAVANAEHNHGLDASNLRIAKITADGGPTLHRWKPRAHGRAAPIRKRTSHIQIILSDESPADVHRSQVKGGSKRKTEGNAPAEPTERKKVEKKSKKTSSTSSEKVSVGAADRTTRQDSNRQDSKKKVEQKKGVRQTEKKVTKKPTAKKSSYGS